MKMIASISLNKFNNVSIRFFFLLILFFFFSLLFSDGEPIKLPDNLESLPRADHFPTQRHRWNTNEVRENAFSITNMQQKIEQKKFFDAIINETIVLKAQFSSFFFLFFGGGAKSISLISNF